MTIYTIGHSTRSPAQMLALLGEAGVQQVIDVRAFPSSRRHPQFNRATLAAWLGEAGIAYRHAPELGGRRQPVPGSGNGGWKERAFQGYADHMRTGEFQTALAQLEATAAESPSVIMCAETVWWRCHRRLIADALVVRGWRVEHLGVGEGRAVHEVGEGRAVHELTDFAVVEPDGLIAYPRAQTALL